MNILIEDPEQLKYLSSTGRWTKDAAHGKSFATAEIAFKIAKQEPIDRFNIVAFISQTGQLINMNHGRGKGGETRSGLENASGRPA